jgi:hypothetical protein
VTYEDYCSSIDEHISHGSYGSDSENDYQITNVAESMDEWESSWISRWESD